MVESILSVIPDKSLYSNLLNDPEAIRRAGNLDKLTVEIFNLAAKGFLEMKIESDPSEGDDYRLEITAMGKKNIEMNK